MVVFAMMAILMVIAWTIQRHAPIQVLYNHSASLPVGWYVASQTEHFQRDDIVLLRQPKAAERFGCVRATSKIFKRIIAMEKDRVCIREGVITVNDQMAFGKTDARLHKQLIWRGCKRIESGQVFLATEHPQSCDSRFYGPVPQNLLWGTARRLLK